MPETKITASACSLERASSTAEIMLNTMRLLIDRHDGVRAETRFDKDLVTFTFIVAPDVIGKVIGKEGQTARSLRVLLGAISQKTGVHFEMDIQVERT